MRRKRTIASEIISRLDDALAEMVLPNPVHRAAPEQGVILMGQPLGQCGAALPFARPCRQDKACRREPQGRQRTGADLTLGLSHLSAGQQENRARSAPLGARPGEGARTRVDASGIDQGGLR